jgi:hypothetical protein
MNRIVSRNLVCMAAHRFTGIRVHIESREIAARYI